MAQLVSFYLLRNIHDFWTLFILAYFIGGVANHALMLAIHEISHNMAYGVGRPLANKLLGIFANLPIGVPLSISFRRYHLDHHRYQGDEILDTDLPTYLEAALFTSPLRKTVWCILQPFFYFIRPVIISPKPIIQLEIVNAVVQIIFDALVVRFIGWHVLIYSIGGTILALGLHPTAGHFISEHTLMFESEPRHTTGVNGDGPGIAGEVTNIESRVNSKQADLKETVREDGSFLIPETCSYYGPLNYLTFNVGYHVEHHDFPSIPGSRLHKLQEIAPEFYKNLNYHTSWIHVIWRYITDSKIGPTSRVRRPRDFNKAL